MANISIPGIATGESKQRKKGLPIIVTIGLVWIAAMIVIAVTADWIRPFNITAFDLKNRLALPGNPKHFLGTDELGRDVLSRLIDSIRISLLIVRRIEDDRAVFGSNIRALPVQRGWIVGREKYRQQIIEGDLGGIVFDSSNLGVSGVAGANLFVGRIRKCASRITRHHGHHTL